LPTSTEPFPYRGDPQRHAAIEAALRGVVDPEMALNIVDLGLVYGVDATDARIAIDLTMTSAACPVAELIIDDIRDALQRALGAGTRVDVALCWEPPWTPERMSASAREAMGW
jgi:metal-sulfur cluster biosynthetic enzyme